MHRPFGLLLAALAVLASVAAPLEAQTTQGLITGRVVQAGTEQPLSDVQIFVVGTQMGNRSAEDGS